MENTALFGLRATAIGVVLLLGPAVCGCAGTDRLKKQVSGLETQLTAMRADQDRLEERLAALELSSPLTPAAKASERVEHPRLKVIHLGPEEPEAAAPPAEVAPTHPADPAGHRPIIRGTGDRVIKLGDGDADESTSRDGSPSKPVAQLGKDVPGS